NAKYLPASINPATLAKLLALKDEAAHPKINASRLLLYQYDPTLRLDPEATRENKEELGSPGGPPTLPLPAVPRALKSGTHYVVTEVLFTLTVTDSGEINWRVFVETSTGAVLYLRAFVSCATGYVYVTDPITASGGGTPSSPVAQQNALRT